MDGMVHIDRVRGGGYGLGWWIWTEIGGYGSIFEIGGKVQTRGV